MSFELSFPLCLWSQFVHHMIHCFLKVKFRKSDLQRSSIKSEVKVNEGLYMRKQF